MRHYLKNKLNLKGLGHGLNGRVPAYQVQGPEFKPHYCHPPKKERKTNNRKLPKSSETYKYPNIGRTMVTSQIWINQVYSEIPYHQALTGKRWRKETIHMSRSA
jgi:hypothetical protein